jgi:hypothetical protein
MRLFPKRSNSKDDDIREESTLLGGRPRLKAAFTNELRASVRNLNEKNETNKSIFGLSSSNSPFRSGGQRLKKEVLNELRVSFHNQNTKQDGRSVRPSTDEGRLQRRPTLRKDVADELRMSFHNRNAKMSSRREEIKNRSMKSRESEKEMHFSSPHDVLRENDSENDSFNGRPNRAQCDRAEYNSTGTGAPPRGPAQRPALRQDVADELRQSFHHRNAKKKGLRQKIVDRIMKRREAKRVLSPHDSSHASSDEGGQQFDGFGSLAEGGFDKRLAHQDPTRINVNSDSLEGRINKDRKNKRQSTSSMETFDASFASDGEGESVFTWRREESRRMLEPRTQASNLSYPLQEEDENDLQDDVEMNKAGWAREKKRMKNDLSISKETISMLTQQVDDLRTEGTDLRRQLSNWQDKASDISKLQSQERIKFDNSTDLIAQARVDLTKALNDNSMLKGQLHDLEMSVDDKKIRIHNLNETIDVQSDKIDDFATKLKDTETELRFNTENRRRVEEELAVIVDSRDGHDIGDTLRRLEQEKAQWSEERERALEAKRMALDDENDRILERQRRKYRQEADQLIEVSEKTRIREDEHDRLQKAINRQLEDMNDSNQALQVRLTSERMEARVETKKKDHSIALLEQDVSKLRRKLAASQLREQENELRRSENDSAKDALKDALKQNRIQERKIERLKSGKDKSKRAEDWKEIILPGYRGVTFGPISDSLAGFLTVLVEEQSKNAPRRTSKSKEASSKFLKEPESEGKKKSKKEDEQKAKQKSKGKDKDKKPSKTKDRHKSSSKEKNNQTNAKAKTKEKSDSGKKAKSKKDDEKKKLSTKDKPNSKKTREKGEKDKKKSEPEGGNQWNSEESTTVDNSTVDKKHKSKSHKKHASEDKARKSKDNRKGDYESNSEESMALHNSTVDKNQKSKSHKKHASKDKGRKSKDNRKGDYESNSEESTVVDKKHKSKSHKKHASKDKGRKLKDNRKGDYESNSEESTAVDKKHKSKSHRKHASKDKARKSKDNREGGYNWNPEESTMVDNPTVDKKHKSKSHKKHASKDKARKSKDYRKGDYESNSEESTAVDSKKHKSKSDRKHGSKDKACKSKENRKGGKRISYASDRKPNLVQSLAGLEIKHKSKHRRQEEAELSSVVAIKHPHGKNKRKGRSRRKSSDHRTSSSQSSWRPDDIPPPTIILQ